MTASRLAVLALRAAGPSRPSSRAARSPSAEPLADGRPRARLGDQDRPPRRERRRARRRGLGARCRRRGRSARSRVVGPQEASCRGRRRSPLERGSAPRPRRRRRGPRRRRRDGWSPPRRTARACVPRSRIVPIGSRPVDERPDVRRAAQALGEDLRAGRRARPTPGRGRAPSDCADRRSAPPPVAIDPPDARGRSAGPRSAMAARSSARKRGLAVLGEDLRDRAAGRATRSARRGR